jgi:hypothetical protein
MSMMSLRKFMVEEGWELKVLAVWDGVGGCVDDVLDGWERMIRAGYKGEWTAVLYMWTSLWRSEHFQ